MSEQYKNAVCRGSWALGSACGKCERCIETNPHKSKHMSEQITEFDINQPFVTQEQKFKYWEESKAHIKEANKRIEALEGEVAELQERLETHIAINKSLLLQRDCLQADNKRLREGVAIIKNSSDSIKTILELQASNNALREALMKHGRHIATCSFLPNWIESHCNCGLNKALSATPAESLQAHDAETIKRYADDLDNNHWVFIPHDLRKPLKGK